MGQNERRYATLGLGICELLFYGGNVFGWATLVFVLKADGYYSHLCTQNNDTVIPTTNNSSPTCGQQDAILNLVFTIGTFSTQICLFFTGLLFDYFGTRRIRLLNHLLLVAGLIMMSLSSPSSSVLLFPGMICIAMGGIQFLTTNLQIGNFFGSRKATVMTIISGCVDSSSFVMLLIKIGYTSGISLRISFAIMAGATVFFFINTFVLLPKRYIPWPLRTDYWQTKKKKKHGLSVKVDENKEEPMAELTETSLVDESHQLAESYRNKDFPNLKSCICSPIFFLLVMWLSILQLRMLYFLGTLNPFLVQITNGNESVVSQFTTIFGFFQISGVFIAPFSGMILDRNKSKKVRGPYGDLQDTALAFAITTMVFVVFSICNAIPFLKVQFVTFTVHVITRSFLFGTYAATVPIIFPGQYFGTLFGLIFALSGLVGLLQFPLFIASQRLFNDDPLVINLILMVACILTIALPVYIYFRANKKINEIQSPLSNGEGGVNNPVLALDNLS